jgi:S-adenosyl-L-methionine hydrolase (adenosine-forming)
MNEKPILALLTDFGLSDAYVGTMQGVILSICPQAQIVDVTHHIAPQNVRQAAYVLLTAFRYFPPETVFVVVVDPGVGMAREPIAVATDYGHYIAPNNGVLSYVLAHNVPRRAVVLDNPDYHLSGVSMTFHGRDIFSPAGAHVANGVPLTALGPDLPELVKLPAPELARAGQQVRGEVLHIDHFGNVITSIGQLAWLARDTLELRPRFGPDQAAQIRLEAATCAVTTGAHRFTPLRRTYGAVAPGELTALVGSAGQLEIGMNQGSAAAELGLTLGDPVTLHWQTRTE